MNAYVTDDEQVERIKKWLKEYAPTIFVSILIVVIATFGWRYWSTHMNNQRAAASNSYEQLLQNAMNNMPGVQTEAAAIIRNYSDTPYAALAALLSARLDVQANQLTAAETQLTWVMEHGKTKSIQQIARNRLARIFIADNKPQQAIDTLNKVNDKSYMTAIDAIRGDAYVALNNPEMARQSYQSALKLLPAADDSRSLLVMKLNDLTA